MSQARSSFPTTRISIILGVQAGDNAAWERFYRIYGPVIYRFARHAGLQEEDAQDTVGRVMRNIFKRVSRGAWYDENRGPFRHLLRRVANNEIAQLRRGIRVRERGVGQFDEEAPPDPISAEAAPDAFWEHLERQELLRDSIEELMNSPTIRPRDLLVFQRFALAGEPAKRVASELGIKSSSRVFVIKHEITKVLREIVMRRLEELREEED